MKSTQHKNAIVIIDLGGQYAHLIASRIRRFGYKSFIVPADTPASHLKDVAGIILSGGPQSVYEKGSPQADTVIFDLGVPVLGLCYGHQWVAHALGGTVSPAIVKEYGETDIKVMSGQQIEASDLFHGLPKNLTVWMSHGDEVSVLPTGFITVASSKDCVNAAMMDPVRRIYGIQFHIEVTHTQHGMDLLRNFVDLCSPEAWNITTYAERISEEILRDVGDKKVFMLVSGGVDSTVAFTLLNTVLGSDRVTGLLVDTGLMRMNEVSAILEAFKPLGITNLHVTDASEEFFRQLENVYDPEEKRRIIGNTFLDIQKRVFDDMGLRIEDGWMLGQGTIYPDTIETGGTKHADKIKTHHNRVPMIQDMIEQGLVIEPLKELYKDEVRQLGEELGLPHDLVWRHPFPGPGLGVRILCAPTPNPSPAGRGETLHMVLPVQSVGVQGDGRTYRHALALFSEHPTDIPELHWSLATSIPNEDRNLNRVLQCLSHTVSFETRFTPTYLTRDVADLLREADAIVDEEMRSAKLYKDIWQFPVVLLPFGESNGARSIVLRPIESTDAMTARAYPLPKKVLQKITDRLLQVEGIDAVFLDLTNKPPGTIEWE
jgi:GMP synthase (glutamine-hydrolysing)